MTMGLSNTQKQRYSRHLLLDGFGQAAQERLLQSKVLIVGTGGLGSPTSLYLAAAGVGCIGLIDCDVVSLTDKNRQLPALDSNMGRPKVEVI